MSVITRKGATERVAQTALDKRVRLALGNGTLIIAALYALLYLIYALTQPGALSVSQNADLLNNALPLAIAAAGGTFVVLTRGFDLSVAGVVSIANVVLATDVPNSLAGSLQGFVIVVLIGLLVGAVNGFLVARMGLQSIASTLATMTICSGIALLIRDAPGGTVPEFITDALTGTLGSILPVAALIAVGVAIVWLAIKRTDAGVALYAVGADENAASLAGIDIVRTKFFAYCSAGALYGIAGYMLSAQTATGNPNAGTPFLLQTFAAIAIGGTSFAGGRGGVIGSMIGAALLMLLQKVLFTAGVSSFYTGIFQGVIMIVAVLIAALSTRFAHAERR